jgi:glutamate-1-semialdehyde 2,1-aminomutase
MNAHLGPLASAIGKAEERYRRRTPRSAAAYAAACRVMPAGNTRSNLHLDPYPVVVADAHDAVLVDVDANHYADFNSDYTVAVLGHSHPRIAEVVVDQLRRGMSWGARSIAETQLAVEIAQRFPAIEHVRFVNSGTEANVMALMTALDATGRDAVLAVDGGYHGSVFSFVGGGTRINVPVDAVVVPYNDLDALDEAFARHGHRLAAAFTELMLNSGGCIPADPEWVDRLRALCTANGALLVVDEVMTARLGYHGLSGVYGVQADLVTLGKFLGGGFPIGAFGASRELMAMYDVRRPGAVSHGGSFNNEVFSMHAGVVALTELLTPSVMTTLNDDGDRLRRRLGCVFAERDVPLVVTGIGSTMAVHVGTVAPTRHTLRPGAVDIRRLLQLGLLNDGQWIAPRGMIATSLATTPSQVDELVAVVERWTDEHRDALVAISGSPTSRVTAPSETLGHRSPA